jgi:hypothetical protein
MEKLPTLEEFKQLPFFKKKEILHKIKPFLHDKFIIFNKNSNKKQKINEKTIYNDDYFEQLIDNLWDFHNRKELFFILPNNEKIKIENQEDLKRMKFLELLYELTITHYPNILINEQPTNVEKNIEEINNETTNNKKEVNTLKKSIQKR